VGLPSRRSHLWRWWSLTPPFHPYPQRLLEDQVRVLGPDHPATLTIRNNLAYWREMLNHRPSK
jgi:hypothetical protein